MSGRAMSERTARMHRRMRVGRRGRTLLAGAGTFADPAKDGNIGADLLRPFTLVMDYPNARMAFVRHDAEPPHEAEGSAAPADEHAIAE